MAIDVVTKISAKPGEREVVITTIIDAPRKLVFKIVNDSKYIPDYWGPKEYSTIVDRMDFRAGGSWRFINVAPDGKEYAFSGVYKEVSPPERVVQTFNYEEMPGHEMTETITYEEKDGKTAIVERALFQSVGERDGMLKTGMKTGSIETMVRFARLLERVRKVEQGGPKRKGKMLRKELHLNA